MTKIEMLAKNANFFEKIQSSYSYYVIFTIDSLQEISAVLGVEITSATDKQVVYNMDKSIATKMEYALCEEPSETITVTIPVKDRSLLLDIASKFGWACSL